MKSKVLLIGDILVDVTLKTENQKYKLRLGGIIHAARYLWSAGVHFDVAFFAPSYLNAAISKYLNYLQCNDSFQVGEVTGAPYIMLIQEVKEVGDQGYEFLLRDEIEIRYIQDGLDRLKTDSYTDAFFISGNYELSNIINEVNADRYHLDLANNVRHVTDITTAQKRFDTIFLSTSSELFRNEFKNDFLQFTSLFRDYTERIILKENRGGARMYNFSNGNFSKGFTQIRQIAHSVGVGDVFDVSFIDSLNSKTETESLIISSWIAAEYSSTTFPEDFKVAVNRILKTSVDRMVKMKGISVPWENRSEINIYIAAPDFDFLDTREIDSICNALKYHNFNPRRPIKENGQMEKDAPVSRKQELFVKDMELLRECSILVAILLNNDPGTLIEIGIASERGMPTIVYDPYGIANNCMLTQIPTIISRDKDKILCEVFIRTDHLINGGK